MRLFEVLESRCLLSAGGAGVDEGVATAAPVSAAAVQALAVSPLRAPTSVTTTQVGTTGLTVKWAPVAGAAKYRIRYTPGA